LNPVRKKDQNADTNTSPRNFVLPLRKNAKIKGCRCTQPPRNGFFKPPQKFSSIGGGGGYIKWNGPALKIFPNIEINECFKIEYGYYFRLELVNVNQSKYTT
jgi:hypothetical protein